MEVRSLAINYASKGWPVLPIHSFDEGCCTCGDETCRSPAKHPITSKGVKEASTDTIAIHQWMDETNNEANLGIATGNGLIVVDIDAKSGGWESLARWTGEYGEFPLTPSVQTGGGGRHYYFACPQGITIGNKAAVVPGIDIRSEGGYVVAPPSLHACGQRYVWETPADTPVASSPTWLLDLLTKPQPRAGATGAVSPNGRMLRVQPPTSDLLTDPGVPEGQRHQKLCQLAGVHLARGESEEQVEALALAWGERCDPPMDEGEIEATVRSLANKHFANATGIVDEESIDSIPLSQQDVAWPILDEHALHGWLGDMVRLIAPETEADPVAILASALVCVGNCFGRKVWFPVEGDRHHANLFACLVGESSRGRKGTSLGRTLTLWAPDDPWRSQCMASGLSSGEGLKWAVRDRVEAIEPIKQKGHIIAYQTVIKDQGVEDKRLLVVESEFAQALKVAKREGNTLSPVIRQAWDTGTLRTLTRNDPTTATDAHVSILGHITMQELNKDMSENDFSNGFANRFLWLAVRRSQMLPDGGSDVDMTPLQVRLHEVLDQTSGVMGRSPAARDLWHQMYPALTADRPGLWGKVTSRGEAQTLRLSMIYALLDGSVTIEVPHLQAAFAVWEYAEASARLIFPEEEVMDPLEKSLMEKIKSSPGINRKQLHKALGGHVQAQAMVQALGKLATQGKARSESIATGGRPSECWWPVEALQAGSTSTHKSTDVPVDDAKEQTESQRLQSGEDTPNRGRLKRRFDVQMLQPGEGLFDRSGATQSPFQDDQDVTEPISLTDLLNDVSALSGKIVRSEDGGFKVRGVDQQRLTSGILAALMKHHDELDLIVPTTSPTPEIGQGSTVVQEQGEGWKPWEEFRAAVLTPKVEDDFLNEFFDRLNALPATV